jgi:hypothetical protein
VPVRLAALVALLVLGCAHSPPPPAGPRVLAGSAQIQRAEASVELTLRYEVREGSALEISAELRGGGSGSVGAVAVELRPDGFELASPATWTAEVAAGEAANNTWKLRPTGEGIARVEVRHGLAGSDLDGSTTAAFRVGPDAIRLCATADCAGDEP